MALTELQEQKYQVIQQRLGEAERAKSRVDWATWTPRLAGAAVFAALAVTVLLVPFRELKPLSVIGKALLVLGGTALYGVYLMRFRPELLRERRKQMFFGASVLLTMGVVHTVAVAGAAHAQEFLSASLAAGTVTTDTVTPAFVFGLLLLSGIAYAVVFDQRFAFDALMINSCAAGLVLLAADAFQPVRLVVAALGSLTAVLFTRNLRSRYRLALVGVVGGVAVAVQLAALYLLGARRLWLVETGTSPLELLLWMAGALVIGAAVGVFSTFLLPVFERVFNITTDLRLIELLEGDHPLITLMQQRAPGTWQHTQNVAMFTKRACEAIGANALLGEVGVKFHDLGKMVRPEFFTENEPESKLLHDRLSPMMSALIILSHVSDGVLMARKAKLPPVMEDFITGHHGTSVIKYFYYKAKENAIEGERIEEGQFRYPGPKPQSRESAIAAIADQVEATARSKFAGGVNHPDDIREMVHASITGKLLDGQFDECGITMRELRIVEDTMVKSLASMYHHRVKYPDDPDKLKRKQAIEAREKYRSELAKRRERILTQ
ncbi:MAG: HDIG domain-containing protein [Planctomycetes bacterium]|nr:HDIG domain-containing protein [Planctomycetota bacterium]MCL4730620.1 HDIG domain-containing protein [Planctomycetota bacterium]